MISRLDPRWPMVWRTPSSVQIGIDPPRVILESLTTVEERLLAALSVGVSESGLAMIARGQAAEKQALLARLAPVLESPDEPADPPTVALSGSGPLASALDVVLRSEGIRVLFSPDPSVLADERPDLAIAVGHLVLPPGLHALWLRRDIPHLPIVFSDSGVLVGPVVEPGLGPCLRCLELTRRDRDRAWPAIASQLLGQNRGAETHLLATEGTVVAARMTVARLADGPAARAVSVRIDLDSGQRLEEEWQPHPECGCRDPEPGSPAPA